MEDGVHIRMQQSIYARYITVGHKFLSVTEVFLNMLNVILHNQRAFDIRAEQE